MNNFVNKFNNSDKKILQRQTTQTHLRKNNQNNIISKRLEL